ncbi:transcription termination factor MTERF8, chloroplastic-like [Gastrolobium bilobum]|uniref:transcription termination factor MTERF8, chloroplastic-like n=1 Tax=Gastrolobium bilobum TaxID=150636 RepID=UPI002AB0C9CA|nr:transcription termination factor MTERF8, chloroplastic-like [Gastrolobium bilobum]
MVLALSLFTNSSCSCSSMMFHPYPLNLSHSLQLSLHPTPSLYPQQEAQALFSVTKTNIKSQPLNKECFRPSDRAFFQCRCSSSLALTDTAAIINPVSCVSLIDSCFVSGTLFSLFREMGIGYEETQLLLLNNPDLTLVSIDSLHARVLCLQSLVFDRVALNHLVMKRPTVLTAKGIDTLLNFLRDELEGQLEQAQLKRFLSVIEPRFFVGFPQKVQLLVDRGIPVDKIVHVLNKINLTKALCHRSMDEIDRIITFLEPFGGIGLIVRWPAILNYDLDNQLIPKIKVLTELNGGDVRDVGKVLHKFPAILSYSVKHVEQHVELLRSFAGLDDQEIFRIILVYPGVVTASRERKLRPRIQFLKECGLDSGDISKFLIKAPLFLAHSFRENIAFKLMFLVKIGYKYRTKELATAIAFTTRTSCENMQKVICLLLSYGFSCEDIVTMSRKQPQILQYNHTSLEEKMEYLIEEMDRDIEELLIFPAFLGYNFDNRIKHRNEVRKSISGGRMSLCELSTQRFGKRK